MVSERARKICIPSKEYQILYLATVLLLFFKDYSFSNKYTDKTDSEQVSWEKVWNQARYFRSLLNNDVPFVLWVG